MTRKLVDVVFVLDATRSTQCVFTGMTRHVEDTTFSLTLRNRKADFLYGAVIFRDPVSYKEIPGAKLDEETARLYKESLEKAKEVRKQKLIEKERYNEEVEAEREQHLQNVNREKFPPNKNIAIPFCDNIESSSIELDQVECDGGNDDQEDWVGALTLALTEYNWREGSKRCIFLISDANAHGKSFNVKGQDNYNEEEPKLINLFQQMAEQRIYFIGLNVKKGTDPGCELTLQAMKDVYERFDGPQFLIQEFNVEVDPDLGDDDWTPQELGNFGRTITDSMNGLI